VKFYYFDSPIAAQGNIDGKGADNKIFFRSEENPPFVRLLILRFLKKEKTCLSFCLARKEEANSLLLILDCKFLPSAYQHLN